MNCEWKMKWVEFLYKGELIKLQGVLPSVVYTIEEAPTEQLAKWYSSNDIWVSVVIRQEPMLCAAEQEDLPEPIKHLLLKYKEVFQEPSSLPPKRAYDHTISLIPGSTPVNSKPYRYTPLQKDEIERQVAKIIKSGLVTTSLSPLPLRFCWSVRKTALNAFVWTTES